MNKSKQIESMLNNNPKQINELRYVLDFGQNQINVKISKN